MDSPSWQDKKTINTTKAKPRNNDSYDDDFELDNSTDTKIKSVDLPKIHQNKTKKNNNSNNQPTKPIQQQGQDDPYADDFQQTSNKQISHANSKGVQENLRNSQKLSPQVNKKSIRPHQDSDDDENYQNNPKSVSKKSPHNQMKAQSKPKSPAVLNKTKKYASSSHIKPSSHQTQSLAKKSSQSVMKNNSLYIQSKYINYLKTQFPQSKEEVQQFPPEKVNRLNQKLRGYIKKVNDELTDLINQNMRLIKIGVKQTKPQGKSVEDVVKILMEQKKNGLTYIETVEKQCSNLADQWEKIRNSDVEGNTEEQIRQISSKIKQYTKQIGILKYDMKMEGNKLTGQNNYMEKVAQLKSKLSIMKRQDEKYTQKLQKCIKNAEELQTKNPSIDIQLQKLLQQAKKQHIMLNFSPLEKKRQQKYQQLKKKVENIRSHQQKTQSLCDTKASIIKKEIDNFKSEISSVDTRFAELESILHSTQQNSVNLIEQSKKKDLEPHIQTHLDFIYNNIKEGNPLTIVTLLKKQNSKQKAGLKKYASSANVKGFIRSQSDAELKPSFHITKKAPLQIKAKDKGELKLGEISQTLPLQRVWKGDSKQAKSNGPVQIQESNSAKPFVIRRSQNVSPPPGESSKKTSQAAIKQGEQKQNDKSASILGPKKLFKKVQTTEVQGKQAKQTPIITEKNANEPVKEQNHEENHSKPEFKIKKARKSIVDIPDEDLYLFPPGTVKDIKDETTKQQPKHNLNLDPPKQLNTSLSIKGPNLKLTDSKNQEKSSQLKLSLDQNSEKTFLTNVQATQIKTQDMKKDQTEEQDAAINIGGRRQVQRKIQRKNQDSYVV